MSGMSDRDYIVLEYQHSLLVGLQLAVSVVLHLNMLDIESSSTCEQTHYYK